MEYEAASELCSHKQNKLKLRLHLSKVCIKNQICFLRFCGIFMEGLRLYKKRRKIMASILDLFGGPLASQTKNFLNSGNKQSSTMMQANQGNFLTGTPAQTQQFQRFNPQQQNVLNQLLSQGFSGLQNQQQFDFAPIEQQAKTGFYSDVVPTIAERFTAMGSGPRSSNFASALGSAGAGLQQSLAALRSQIGLQQQGQQQNLLQNLLQLGLTPQFENAYTPAQPGFAESAGAPILQALGQSLPYLLPILLGGATGGAGAAAGGVAAGIPLLVKLLQAQLRK